MLKRDIQIGGRYTAKVSNQLTTVRITGVLTRGRGWSAINEATKRQVTIKTAAKLRGPADPIVRPVNGNGERMMTPNQRDLIAKLLNEKVVDEGLVGRFHSADIEDRVTLEAASMFIKHMIDKCPRKDAQQSLDSVKKMSPSEAGEALVKSVAKQAATKTKATTKKVKRAADPQYVVTLTGRQLEIVQELFDLSENDSDEVIATRVAIDSAIKQY